MFLVERLIGIGIYAVALLMTCLLMIYTTARVKTILRLYIVVLCVMAFFYEPYVTADLYRIFDMMEVFTARDFQYFYDTYLVTSSVPASRLLFYTIGMTGVNHLLPLVSTAITYSMLFYILQKTHERYAVSKTITALTLFLLMSSSIYISVIGGIRMMMAMAIVAFCFYRESVEKTFNVIHILLYVIAVFMHNMAIVVFGLRLLVPLFDKTRKKRHRILLLLGMIVAAALAFYFLPFIFSDTLEKALEFLSESMYMDYWEYAMGILFGVIYLVIYRSFRSQECSLRYQEIAGYGIGAHLSVFVAIVFCFDFSIFYRFIGHFMPIILAPMMMVTLQDAQNQNKRVGRSLSSWVFLLSMVLFVLSCARGSLSSLKFFVIE